MIYLTSDTNKGVFWKRFHETKLEAKDLLIILGDTGMNVSEAYEGQYKLDWLDTREYETFVVVKKENGKDDDSVASFSKITYMHGGKTYILNDIKFLILNDSTNLDGLEEVEVDYVLATNYGLLEKTKNKITYKHTYVGENDGIIVAGANVTFLNEDIVQIQ